MARDCTPSRRVLLSMTAVVVVLTGVSVLVAQHPSSSVAGFLEVASGHALQLAPTHHVPPSSVDGASHAGDTIPLAVGVNSPMFLELHSASRPVTTPGLPTTSGGGSSNVLFPLADTLMPFANPYDAINVAALLPKIATRGTTADTVATVDSFAWAPGGVRGASRHEVDAVLDKLFRDARSASEIRQALCAASSTPVRGLITSLAQSLAVLDTTSDIGGDCRYHLTPMQRATCIGMALADDEADEVPLHDRRAYRESNCRVLAPCADWARGRFSTPLSAELLDRVYEDVVVPSVHQHADAVQAFSRQFLHGEGNFEELKWLMRRSKAMELDLEKRRQISAFLSPRDGKRRNPRHALHPVVAVQNATWWYTPTGVQDVFQGAHASCPWGSLYCDPSRGLLSTPLAILAVLHRMIGPALDGDGDAGGMLNVMTFNGDSVNREVFHRLIHHIRFGDDRRPLQRAGNERYFPHFHYATHYDMVYVVHPTHDELLGFHSPQTNGSSTYTVEAYFREVRRNVTRWRGAGGEASAPVALMYVVWYWDPFTSMPRPCAFGAEEAGPFAEHGDGDAALATASGQGALSRIGVRASVLVQGTAFWERTQGDAVMHYLSTDAKFAADARPRTQGKAPRRMYLLSAVSEDLLTAYPQHLTHRLYNDTLPEREYQLLRISSKTPNYNIRKNIGYFKWLRATALARRGVDPQTLRYGAVHILDKAKAQFLGEPMGDKIHFTCRGGFATGKPKFFEHAFATHSLSDLLLGANASSTTGGPSEDRAMRFCHGTAHAVQLLKTMQTHALGAKFALWAVSGMEATRVHGYHLAGSMLPSSILRPDINRDRDADRRTVVYMFPDGSRRTCMDPGDGLLVQLVLQNAVLTQLLSKP